MLTALIVEDCFRHELHQLNLKYIFKFVLIREISGNILLSILKRST